MKFHITTFGCQMNVHDSQWLNRALESRGWVEADESEAQVFILNTCSVRDKPEQKVYSELGRIAAHVKRDENVFAAVGGCVAQQVGKGFFDRFPFVKLVFGSDGIADAPNALERIAAGKEERLALLDFVPIYEEREQPEEKTITIQKTRQAFVNIMQGCDNFCSYCIVPYTRGRQKSRHPEAVIDECRLLVESGVREISLLGQNVNSFGLDKGGVGVSFADLLTSVAAIEGLERLRFTTSHPKDIAPEVIAAFGELENVCPSLHLPMQAGSDRVLKAMRRKYDITRYLSIVDGLKAARPDIALTTDIIVGFPGETEEDFQETLDMVEKVGFESSFSFKYSDRPGVAAVNMEPKVSPEEASERLMRLQTLQNNITRKCLKNLVGNETIAFIEGLSRKQDGPITAWKGRDPAGRIVNVDIDCDSGLVGMMVPVKIVEAKKHSLNGEKDWSAVVEVEIFGLALDESGKSPIIVLKDMDETKVLPIWIGAVEAMSISMAINEVPFPRPMTHDLLLNAIRALGGTITRVEITDIENGTFFSEIVVTTDKETRRIDSRPSDAIALAVRAECKILASESVLEEAGAPFPEHAETVISTEDSDTWVDELEKLSEDDIKYKM